MSVPIFPNMPPFLFPIAIEAFDPATDVTVWQTIIEKPPHQQTIEPTIPAGAVLHDADPEATDPLYASET